LCEDRNYEQEKGDEDKEGALSVFTGQKEIFKLTEGGVRPDGRKKGGEMGNGKIGGGSPKLQDEPEKRGKITGGLMTTAKKWRPRK